MISHPVPLSDLELQLKPDLRVMGVSGEASRGHHLPLEPDVIEEHLFTLLQSFMLTS